MEDNKILRANRIVKINDKIFIALRSNYMTLDWGVYPIPSLKLIAKIDSVPRGCENMVV